MIPATEVLEPTLVVKSQPSLTYRLDAAAGRIVGMTNGLEAIRQAVYKILATERYQYVIYSWNYGVELQNLLGMMPELASEYLPHRIREALLQDDRIQEITDFAYTRERDKLHLTFTVQSIEGNFQMVQEVNL